MELILAVNQCNVIGYQDANGEPQLPWNLPNDMKWFKMITTGKTVVMGSTTFRSLNRPNGLPNRKNVVMSTSMKPTTEIDVVGSWDELLERYGTNVIIIGGATLYDAAMRLNLVDKLYITCVCERFPQVSLSHTVTETDFFSLGFGGFDIDEIPYVRTNKLNGVEYIEIFTNVDLGNSNPNIFGVVTTKLFRKIE